LYIVINCLYKQGVGSFLKKSLLSRVIYINYTI
jgi:hypothetical protein